MYLLSPRHRRHVLIYRWSQLTGMAPLPRLVSWGRPQMTFRARGSQEAAVLRQLLRPSYLCMATTETAHGVLSRLNHSTYPHFRVNPHGIGMEVGTSGMGE